MPLAKEKNSEKTASGPGKATVISRAIPILIVSILAGGGGFLQGTMVKGKPVAKSENSVTVNAKPPDEGKTAAEDASQGSTALAKMFVRPLAPIISNLGNPSETWMRLELSLLLDPKEISEQDVVAAQAAESVVTFLRTVELKKIEGPSGFLHFREDLGDMLSESYQGKITGVLIGSMVVE